MNAVSILSDSTYSRETGIGKRTGEDTKPLFYFLISQLFHPDVSVPISLFPCVPLRLQNLTGRSVNTADRHTARKQTQQLVFAIHDKRGAPHLNQTTNCQITPPEPFRLTFTRAYATFVDGQPPPVPYVVDGLLTQGGLSLLGGKPKNSKSSLARYLGKSVAMGTLFLGRDTEQGDVILINLEDPPMHVDNCLKALGYEEGGGHGQIEITTKLSPSINETCDALVDALVKRPDVRFIAVDHLAKFLRIKDWSEYIPVQQGFQMLHDIAREFSRLHIQVLVHCKKVETSDPFDQILGSTALRGEPDTNVVIFQQNGERFLVSETRVGRPLPATLLKAELVTSAGADVVSSFSLGVPFDEWQSDLRGRAEKGQGANYRDGVIKYLQTCDGDTAYQQDVLKNVTGKSERVVEAIKELNHDGVLIAEGSPRTLKLLDGEALKLYRLISRIK
jgi:hypothetical protein